MCWKGADFANEMTAPTTKPQRSSSGRWHWELTIQMSIATSKLQLIVAKCKFISAKILEAKHPSWFPKEHCNYFEKWFSDSPMQSFNALVCVVFRPIIKLNMKRLTVGDLISFSAKFPRLNMASYCLARWDGILLWRSHRNIHVSACRRTKHEKHQSRLFQNPFETKTYWK